MAPSTTEHLDEVKKCYQATKKLLQDRDGEDIGLPRTSLQCLAAAVISELGDTGALLRECLRSTSEAFVTVPRSALVILMKGVATWLTGKLRQNYEESSATKNLEAGTHLTSKSESPATITEVSRWKGRILVVGAGATGACVSRRLRSALGGGAHITVWEKARGAGGRMSTNRQEGINVRADMGAQYLSLDGRDKDCLEIADRLVSSGVCADVRFECLSQTCERPYEKGWRHLAGVAGGVNDALKKILEEAKADVCYEQRVGSLDEQRGQWRVKAMSGSSCSFDAVIIAIPGCGIGGDNLNKINGGWERMISTKQNKQLLGVQHDQRWAFAFFFPADVSTACDAFFGSRELEKIVDDSIVHLLCYQSRKTVEAGGPVSHKAVAIVAHTTTEWARRNSRANGRDQRLLTEVAERVKQILRLNRTRLLASKVITWKQSQVTRTSAVNDSEGPCMLISRDPPLLLAGDYFTESNFGGCLKSGYAAADKLSSILVPSSGEPEGKRRKLQ